jgi:hypothetical protein
MTLRRSPRDLPSHERVFDWAMLKFWSRLQAPSRLARILGLADHVEKFQSLRSESFNFNTNYGLIRPGASCFIDQSYCA